MTATATAKAKAKTLAELRKFDGPLYVQNNTPFKVNAHDTIGDTRFALELAPAGDPDSIAVLPKVGLESRSIQRMWLSGKLAVSTDDRMEDQIALMLGQSITEREGSLANMAAQDADGNPIVPTLVGGNTQRGMVEKACLVCGRYNQQTGVLIQGRVTQTVVDENHGVPPLCELHKDQTSSYIPRQVSDGRGETHWEFEKVDLGKPSIQIQ